MRIYNLTFIFTKLKENTQIDRFLCEILINLIKSEKEKIKRKHYKKRDRTSFLSTFKESKDTYAK